MRPNLEGFKLKIKIKYQTDKYISTKNNDLVENGQIIFHSRIVSL